jgi:hypothetical protein
MYSGRLITLIILIWQSFPSTVLTQATSHERFHHMSFNQSEQSTFDRTNQILSLLQGLRKETLRCVGESRGRVTFLPTKSTSQVALRSSMCKMTSRILNSELPAFILWLSHCRTDGQGGHHRHKPSPTPPPTAFPPCRRRQENGRWECNLSTCKMSYLQPAPPIDCTLLYAIFYVHHLCTQFSTCTLFDMYALLRSCKPKSESWLTSRRAGCIPSAVNKAIPVVGVYHFPEVSRTFS